MRQGRIVVGGDPRFRARALRLRADAARVLAFIRLDASVHIILVGAPHMDTNVLSFQAPPQVARPDFPTQFLGELYLNPEYIARHGESLRYMLIHGLLHLVGYDHVRARARMRMERVERRIMRALREPSSGAR